MGVIAIDPKNPNVLWLGTGENASQRSAGYGDGVKYPEKGKIGLQLHGGVHMKMNFKDIKIKPIEGE